MVSTLRYRLGWYRDTEMLDQRPLPGPMTVRVATPRGTRRWQLDRGPDADDPTKVRLTLTSDDGTTWSGTDSNFFDALLDLRLHLDRHGIAILINGARRRVWPSPAIRHHSLGLVVCSLYPGIAMHTFTSMRLFGPAPRRSIAPTVAHQVAHYTKWLLSTGQDPTNPTLRP